MRVARFPKDGSEIKRWRGRSLKSLKKAVAREQAVDLEVDWAGADKLNARLIVTWAQANKRLRYLDSKLPREGFRSSKCVMPIA